MAKRLKVRSEEAPAYGLPPETVATYGDDVVIACALEVLGRRLRQPGQVISSPADTQAYLVLKLAEREQEVFACLFLDSRHRVIEFKEMFYGTIDGASVHPREVVKAALAVNAAAVVFAHNHPSGVLEPSRADQHLTTRLKDSLALIDVRALDHIIVGGAQTLSFAERGLI